MTNKEWNNRMAKNYYEILGVDRNATQDEIKKAYRKLSKTYHPDKTNGDKAAEEKFKEVAEAYEILSDETKKKNYDLTGDISGNFGGGGQNRRHHPSEEDIFREFEKFRTGNYGGGIRKGSSIQVIVNMTLEDIFSGSKKKIKYKKDINCNHCKGNGSKNGTSLHNCGTCGGTGRVVMVHGQFHIENFCHNCGGYGKIITEECDYCSGAGVAKKDVELDVDIPAGVRDGWQTAIQGYGNDAITDGKGVPGDLFLIISQVQHDKFEREADNLIFRLQIPFTQAALGDKVEVPTIDGKTMSFDLKECTPYGQFFRMRGRGLPSFARKGFVGDMLVLVEFKMPNKLTDKEKELLKKLSKEENFKTK